MEPEWEDQGDLASVKSLFTMLELVESHQYDHLPKLCLWMAHAHKRLCAGVDAYKIEKMLRPEEALI